MPRPAASPRGSAKTLDLLAGNRFDVALFDVKLHEESIEPAADVCLARSIPVVFATGYTESGLAERFRDAPLVGKPYSMDELQRALLAAVGPRG